MWQRKQTIYLVVATMLMGILAWLSPRGSQEGIILMILALIAAVESFITIFFFKNRKIQMMQCNGVLVWVFAWIAYYAYNTYKYWTGQFYLWEPSLLPIVTFVVVLMAKAGIKHDEELIKSMDRIRTIAILMATGSIMLTGCTSDADPIEGDMKTVDIDDTSIELVFVAPGNFRMGATSEQDGFDSFSELPAHDVQISKGYWIGVTEVTQAQWEDVMGKNPAMIKTYKDKEDKNLPIMNITWADAQAFVKKLSEKTGCSFRLPTEAEWEYAARGASKTNGLQYSGSKYVDRVACFRQTSEGAPHPVGQYMPNELEMRDMQGNVSEWVEDNFEPYKDTVLVDPCVKTGVAMPHVARGGSFNSTQTECRTASRENYDSEYKSVTVGLRVVMEK